MNIQFLMAPNLRGLEEFIQTLNVTHEALLEAATAGLSLLSIEIIEKSLELIPYDTGAAASTAYVGEARIIGSTVTIYVGYGSGSVTNPKTGKAVDNYIVELHENWNMKHKPGKSAKFLEIPYMWITRARMIPYLQDFLSAVLLGTPRSASLAKSLWRRRSAVTQSQAAEGYTGIESFAGVMRPRRGKKRRQTRKAPGYANAPAGSRLPSKLK